MNQNIKSLVAELNEYRDAYYNRSDPLVTDAEYDALFNKLKQLEHESGIVLSNSPTQTVGYEVKSKLNKVKHDIPLLSLDKTKDINTILDFSKANPCLLMLKLDGLTVELLYKDGLLIQASTRGDGHIGEDITHNAKVFNNIPLTIPYKGLLRVTGEAIIHKQDFNTINDNLSTDEKAYANARNLVSGSVRQLDSKICANRNVCFILWDVLEGLDEECDNARSDKIAHCVRMGFESSITKYFVYEWAKEYLPEWIEEMKYAAEKEGIPIDGLVIKYDSITYSKQLGGTSHHNNDGLAFKFEDEVVESRLQNIEWSLGRSGQLIPVAVFDPIKIGGTIISRASLHNVTVMKNLLGDFPHNSQKIFVMKANQIIPQIVTAEKRLPSDSEMIPEHSDCFKIPDCCPVCGFPTILEKSNNTEIVSCVNPHCTGKRLSRFEHFVSKQAMNIEGISTSTLEHFIEKNWLKEFVDIYKLDQHRNEIIRMNGFGERAYDKLWDAIQISRTVSLDKFLVSLGIPTIGKTAAKSISNYCHGDISEFEYLINQNFDWSILDDFGQTTSDNIKNWFNDPFNATNYVDLLNFIQIQKPEVKEIKSSAFVNKTVVVTGTLKHFTRDSITDKLEELGANVSGSVSKKTNYLIAGEKAGSKLSKARQFGVNILTENQFLEMIS